MSSAGTQSTNPQFVSTARTKIIDATSWNQRFRELGVQDTYFRSGYYQASRALEPGAAHPVLLELEAGSAKVLLPLLVRELPEGEGFDATTAYGYGGAASDAQIDAPEFAKSLDEWAQENQVVASFIRCHPLLQNQAVLPANAHEVLLGHTVAWRTDADRLLLESMHKHHRRAVRKADREGLEVEIIEAPTDLSAFRELYELTMKRQEAEDFYFFAESYWQGMLDNEDVELVLVNGMLDGELIASLLCFQDEKSLHYHLGASADAARNIGASNRCFLAAAEWAQSNGKTRFHLGGGYGGGTESPLFVFKHRYDPESTPREFHIAKLVHMPERYRDLVGSDSVDGYFPPWRA